MILYDFFDKRLVIVAFILGFVCIICFSFLVTQVVLLIKNVFQEKKITTNSIERIIKTIFLIILTCILGIMPVRYLPSFIEYKLGKNLIVEGVVSNISFENSDYRDDVFYDMELSIADTIFTDLQNSFSEQEKTKIEKALCNRVRIDYDYIDEKIAIYSIKLL